MKDYLENLVRDEVDNNHARSLVREYLQARTLLYLQNAGAFENWAFVGGTALRFLYSLERFSEDLNFSLVSAEDKFTQHLKAIKSSFEKEAYTILINAKEDRVVKSAFLKFEGLLFELGLSPHASENVSIKLGIDTNPPAGAGVETSIIRRHVLLNILHYDKASLFAGKLHAIFARPYAKGRDLYDLLWYLSDLNWPEPNIMQLNNAISQTEGLNLVVNAQNWRETLLKRLETLDWKQVIQDVSVFVEKKEELELLTAEHFKKLLS